MGLIDSYCVDAVTITPKGTLGNDGKYDFDGTAVSTTARVRKATGHKRDADGTEYVYTVKVWLRGNETLVIGDRITHVGTNYEVKDITERDSLTGTLDHYEVFCG
ncbi:MAG: head-tail adaptor protein [bacterium]|nr:head-tail adaptor protein [bacterium]